MESEYIHTTGQNIKFIAEVFCENRFVGFHQWIDAPEEFRHLGVSHRHEFHVTVSVYVKRMNRDVEFQKLKTVVRDIIYELDWSDSNFNHPITLSCEDMARSLGTQLHTRKYKPSMVQVSEDGENGGRVTYDYSGE